MKAICVLRVSTDRQDILQQKTEMKNFMLVHGFTENQTIYIEGIGASAIKLNDKYLAMLHTIKTTIEDNSDARTVFIWHLNRLGGNDEVLIELKNYFIKNGVQLIVKEPSLKLLNEDGTVNSGAELAYSLFATMVKQDMAEKAAKFKRAKDFKRKQGKCVAGNALFGYKKDNGFLVEDKETADVVRTVYELYATGKYSFRTLRKELGERGIEITETTLARMLKNKAYIGDDEQYHKYPPIISDELFNAVASVRNENNNDIEKGHRILLGTKILKCPDCGGNFYCEFNHYVCYHNRLGKTRGYECGNNLSANADIIDSILWNIASIYHMEYLNNLNEEQVEGLKVEAKVIEEKLDTAYKKEGQIEKRKERVMTSYFKGEIDETMKDKWLANINKDNTEIKKIINELEEKETKMDELIQSIKMDLNRRIEKTVDIDFEVIEMQDRSEMRAIVKRHIKEAYLSPKHMDIGEGTYKGYTLDIRLINGQEWHLFYAANKRVGNRLWLSGKDGWKPYTVDMVKRDGGI